MDLANYWVVGFAGARRLSPPEVLRTQIREALHDLKDMTDGQLVGMSSAAMGADLIFIEEVAAMKIPLLAVLPFPADYFFNEKDFPDPAERDAARKAVAGAADCEIVRIPRDRDEAGESTWRRLAFADAGFKCVDECDVFIAVVEEAKAGRPGGTARSSTMRELEAGPS